MCAPSGKKGGPNTGLDKIGLTILEDGTISVKTDSVSKTNHVSADELLKAIKKFAGGEHTKEDRKDVKARVRSHDHEHHQHHHHA